RFFTVPKVSDARRSAGWALVFITILYTTAPGIAAFSRMNFADTVHEASYESAPDWFKNWEDIGLIAWMDKNNDGKMHYGAGDALGNTKPIFTEERGASGERLLQNAPTDNANEIYVDRDIMVLANPEIANLPAWVIALVAAGGLAAALSTAAGLLLVISTSISHDLLKKTFVSDLSEKQELMAARVAAAFAVGIAGYFGINPPRFVAQVVAFAFGLAAASLFPALFMGIFVKAMNREGAIAGMVAGMAFTWAYIAYFKFWAPEMNTSANWFMGISPEGIGFIGMLINFAIALTVMRFTAPVPDNVQNMVEAVRIPIGKMPEM
ncbi:MAG: VC_2705 family sodium/solute symporter, partial [Sphingomonadales bacterium]|nr:VC_2705 family sodium/solute symporter [Sphingomonadales bacterium]